MEDRNRKANILAVLSIILLLLVPLFGYRCVPTGPRFLLSQFLHNGTLDKWIFPPSGDPRRPGGCLSWDLRSRVAVDVAKALSYLHPDCRLPILHLDVKPETILLDEN